MKVGIDVDGVIFGYSKSVCRIVIKKIANISFSEFLPRQGVIK